MYSSRSRFPDPGFIIGGGQSAAGDGCPASYVPPNHYAVFGDAEYLLAVGAECDVTDLVQVPGSAGE